MARNATYKQIQGFIKDRHGVSIQTCWIAHAKELNSLPVRKAHNRNGEERAMPCPSEKLPLIREAFKHFNIL